LDGHSTLIGEMRIAYEILVGKPEGKGSLDLDRRIILKWIFKKYIMRVGLHSFGTG
jgi:hypothetical protein